MDPEGTHGEPAADAVDRDPGRRGVLRIYLGAAPGVGKTFAMLGEAHRRLERGTDVVVGLVETHDRVRTARLAEDLEVVPRQRLSYGGREFTEMDADSVLARRPDVAVVDELAHTNVTGARNAKGWQDVAELLAAGIGIGLSVAKGFVEAMNGTIRAEETPGGGLTIVISRPTAHRTDVPT